ncbi:MAG: hypothetical protein DRJ63_00350 [Thermoprotei archaeon]|nr:MAG: hypothetical protein DRJ63_00350 [Thermoprotei archaeon]
MEEILVKKAGSELKEVEIAKELGILKQAVSKALREARAKLTQIFLMLSETLNSNIIKINVNKGFMVLRNREKLEKMYVIYVPGEGPRVFFGAAEESCENEQFYKRVIGAAVA